MKNKVKVGMHIISNVGGLVALDIRKFYWGHVNMNG